MEQQKIQAEGILAYTKQRNRKLLDLHITTRKQTFTLQIQSNFICKSGEKNEYSRRL